MSSETNVTEPHPTESERWIEALRGEQDRLAERVRAFSPDELSGPSACTDWTIAQVLSHLGSGAEIMGATVRAAVRGTESEPTDNQAIWDRWNAMSPAEQAAGFLDFAERIVADLESLDADGRANIRFDIAFLPEPADVSTVAALRLNELALHAWDVFVMDDPAAPLAPSAVDLLIDRAGVLIGFIGHPEAIEPRPVQVAFETAGPTRSLGLELDEQAALGDAPSDPAATATLPAESMLRLVAGRLQPDHTPSSVSVTGSLTLDDLRRVFPGY